MGFVERWISLVMGCVKSVAFAIIINGQLGRRFKPSKGIKFGHRGPSISHILFADDTLVFLKATKPCYDQLVNLLNDLCEASGQLVNFSKSCLFFSQNTPEAIMREIESSLRIGAVEDPGKYLGKEVLLKVVLQAIPAYPMSIFRIPNSLFNEFNPIMANFW
ncbi:hypothetical protein L3X38_018904 [Prunus dulcis]|uniref:Reverse transcriptase domain-containing protein n=1 Tax=Prunus dulcis TaxID=3755 RepID=A0AAD4WCK7_PRUDU|nr:hypothetical protein L3X38_018904 [Prunus dulcis]